MGTHTCNHEMIFVDSRVQDWAVLLKDLPSGAEVSYLKAAEAGLQQMAVVLGERGDASAVQVLVHDCGLARGEKGQKFFETLPRVYVDIRQLLLHTSSHPNRLPVSMGS